MHEGVPRRSEGRDAALGRVESWVARARPAKDLKARESSKSSKSRKPRPYLKLFPRALIRFGGFRKSKKVQPPDSGEADDSWEQPCGVGCVASPCCECCKNIRCFMVFHCILVICQGVIFGLIDVSIGDFQRQYYVKTIENLALQFSYDISSALVVIFVAFYGDRKKVTCFVVSSFLVGFGSLLCAFPSFTEKGYQSKAAIEGIAECSEIIGYALGYVIGAPLVKVHEHSTAAEKTGQLGNLTAPCNQNCSCSSSIYSSICGRDDVEYFSPCFAGCMYSKTLNQKKTYYNCSCIKEGLTTEDGEGDFIDARPGKCDAKCYKLPLFVAFIFSTLVFSSFCSVPILLGIMQVVPETLRSLALGVSYVILRIFGTIPGPFIFKISGESSCIFRDTNDCGHRGQCWIYNQTKMAYLLVGICFVCKLCTLIFTTIAFLIYKHRVKDSIDIPDIESENPEVKKRKTDL
uniref:Solute carrier organic anion transporter family member 6A1 n=1 Tax=Saimiri boliviensis boliviensis TaxID=39432 RepID=A0A2K6T8A2_SAIBB